MKTFVPSYYNKFKCIADKCTHNCCIGWEIYVDSDTLDKYVKFDRELGTSILEKIKQDEDGAVFLLDKDERCVNLNEYNLCNIISCHGENALCDICREHPRFRNYFDGREEVGLGLSCEEVARILLSYSEKVKFEAYCDGDCDKGEENGDLLRDRDEVISRLQDRSLSTRERIENVSSLLDESLPYSDLNSWCDFFMSLERLDEKWTAVLSEIKKLTFSDTAEIPYFKNELAAEQLLVYFVCRHYKASLDTNNIAEVFKFSYISTSMIFAAAEVLRDDFETYFEALCESARMYSSEVEYSTDNTDELFFELSF